MKISEAYRVFVCMFVFALVLISSEKLYGVEQNISKYDLDDVIQNNKSGLEFMDKDELSDINDDLRQYILLKENKISKAQKKKIIQECEEDDDAANIFCEKILAANLKEAQNKKEKKLSKKNKKKLKDGIYSEIRSQLINANIEFFNSVDSQNVIEAIKGISDFEELKPIINKALAREVCITPKLSMALALEIEEKFPDEASIDLASKLYNKAAICGNEKESLKAAYRLALIHVWKNDYKAASELFTILIENEKNLDLRARALFWGAKCAGFLKNEKVQTDLQNRLLKDHPFSLHSLMLKKMKGHEEKILEQKTYIVFRSGIEKFDEKFIAIELLQKMKKHHLARTFVNDLLANDDELSSANRMYLAVLADRNDDEHTKFRILTSLFKNDSSFINKTTLSMMFPVERKNEVLKYKMSTDEYLIVALMRQESAFNSKAKSPVGAMGLMQLMPKTARRFEKVKTRALLDPSVNIRIGAKYFKHLMGLYDNKIELALAAYNAGEEKVDDWLKRYPIKEKALFMDIMPFRETRDYVASIVRNYYYYNILYRGKPSVLPLD